MLFCSRREKPNYYQPNHQRHNRALVFADDPLPKSGHVFFENLKLFENKVVFFLVRKQILQKGAFQEKF